MADNNDNNPGQVISPGDSSGQSPSAPQSQGQGAGAPPDREQPASQSVLPAPAEPNPPDPTADQTPYVAETSEQQMSGNASDIDEAAAFYDQQEDDDPNHPEEPQSDGEAVTWTASEYVAHHKTGLWYMVLAVGTIGVSGLVYWVTGGDIISTAVIILVAIVFGMYAGRKPQVQEYSVSAAGITIGPKRYPYKDLKSFSIIDEGPFSSISFMPLKRFMPIISIYYDPADEHRIVDILSAHLPVEQRGHDAIDRLMKKIRF